MEDLFVDYYTALKLKELGFKERCFGAYKFLEDEYIFSSKEGDLILGLDVDKNHAFVIKAPLKTQIFKWFLDKYKLHSFITPKGKNKFVFHVLDIKNYVNITYNDSDISGGIMLGEGVYYDTPEEAENECVNYLIKLIDEKV